MSAPQKLLAEPEGAPAPDPRRILDWGRVQIQRLGLSLDGSADVVVVTGVPDLRTRVADTIYEALSEIGRRRTAVIDAPPGCSITAFTDAQLARIGLQRIPGFHASRNDAP